MTEAIIHRQVCDYIRLQYPGVFFNSDGAGNNLSRAQAGMAKMLRSHRGYPDLFIAEPRKGYHGLYIELKREGTKLRREKDCTAVLKDDHKLRKAGDWWDLHTEEQAIVMETLAAKGYYCAFGVGFEDTTQLI